MDRFLAEPQERENKVADCMSRLYDPLPKLPTNLLTDLPFSDKQLTASLCLLTPTSFDQIMIAVHGGSRFHFGAHETWSKAKQLFPGDEISLRAVQDYVKTCPMYQLFHMYSWIVSPTLFMPVHIVTPSPSRVVLSYFWLLYGLYCLLSTYMYWC